MVLRRRRKGRPWARRRLRLSSLPSSPWILQSKWLKSRTFSRHYSTWLHLKGERRVATIRWLVVGLVQHETYLPFTGNSAYDSFKRVVVRANSNTFISANWPMEWPSPVIDWRLWADAWECPIEERAMLHRRPAGLPAGVVARANVLGLWRIDSEIPGAALDARSPYATFKLPTGQLPVDFVVPVGSFVLLRSETRAERGSRR